MSSSGNITLPSVHNADSDKTPVSDKKRESLGKRLAERVSLADTEYADNGDIQGFCPFHEDAVASNKPSARFNPTYNTWVCYAPQVEGCAEKGSDANLDRMLRKLSGEKASSPNNVRSIGSAPTAKKKRKGFPEITQKQSTDFMNTLLLSRGALDTLADRRLWDEDTVSALGLGIVDGSWSEGLNNKPRITIPVHDRKGKYVGCRIYDALGNATSRGDYKFFWSGGETRPPEDAVFCPGRRKALHKTVVIVEGEPDAILAYQDFRDSKTKISFVSATRGANKGWPSKANDMLLNRDVYLMMDNDEAGQATVEKSVKALQQGGKVDNIYVMRVPERKGVKDWTDYRRQVVGDPKVARQTMIKLMDDAEHRYSRTAEAAEAARRATAPTESALRTLPLRDASSLGPADPGAVTDVTILSRSESPQILPTRVELTCARDKGKKCDSCPLGIYEDHGKAELTYFPHEGLITEFVGASSEQKEKKYKKDSGAKCADIENYIHSAATAYPYLVEDSDAQEQEASGVPGEMYMIDTGDIDSSSMHRVHYNRVSFWKDSSARYFAWAAEDLGNDLDNFEMSEKTDKRLRAMLHQKDKTRDLLELIADDFAWNVTRIFGERRKLLHILTDLVYHSVLRLPFEEQTDMKGWMDVMVMGDSHTGKSETTRKMFQFYGLGETVNGGSATRAGLLAGNYKPFANSGFMFAKKGALPRNHRRLLTIEESHKLATRRPDEKGIIPQMADARDYGEFNLQTVSEIKTPSATRLLWIANPPGDSSRSTLAEIPYGAAEAISTMMGGRENVTRFTMAIAVSEDDVETEYARPRDDYKTDKRFTAKPQALRDLVLWAWSRRAEQVEWEDGAEAKVRERADKMAKKLPADFPIAKPQDLYSKLARVSAAIAARVYSSPDGERLVIKKKHVVTAANFMMDVYSMESMGMNRMVRIGLRAEEQQVNHRDEAIQKLHSTGAHGICDLIIQSGEFDPQMQTGLDKETTQDIVALLHKGAFLRPEGRKLRATKELVEVAREAQARMDAGPVRNKRKSARGKQQMGKLQVR